MTLESLKALTDEQLVEKVKECATCGVPFRRPPSAMKKTNCRYCSRQCYRLATRKRPFVMYKGKAYMLNVHGYYEASDGEKMHRRVWQNTYGAPPEGCVIHHKDGDKTNNDLSNLEPMPWGEHSRHHHKTGRTMATFGCTYCRCVVNRPLSATRRSVLRFCNRRCHMLYRNRVLGINPLKNAA